MQRDRDAWLTALQNEVTASPFVQLIEDKRLRLTNKERRASILQQQSRRSSYLVGPGVVSGGGSSGGGGVVTSDVFDAIPSVDGTERKLTAVDVGMSPAIRHLKASSSTTQSSRSPLLSPAISNTYSTFGGGNPQPTPQLGTQPSQTQTQQGLQTHGTHRSYANSCDPLLLDVEESKYGDHDTEHALHDGEEVIGTTDVHVDLDEEDTLSPGGEPTAEFAPLPYLQPITAPGANKSSHSSPSKSHRNKLKSRRAADGTVDVGFADGGVIIEPSHRSHGVPLSLSILSNQGTQGSQSPAPTTNTSGTSRSTDISVCATDRAVSTSSMMGTTLKFPLPDVGSPRAGRDSSSLVVANLSLASPTRRLRGSPYPMIGNLTPNDNIMSSSPQRRTPLMSSLLSSSAPTGKQVSILDRSASLSSLSDLSDE